MRAMVLKEFRQLRRDRRTVAMMVVMPLLLLVVFGFAASFDVDTIPTLVVGQEAEAAAGHLPDVFDVTEVDSQGGRAAAIDSLRNSETAAAVIAGPRPAVLLDGSELFSAQAALRSFSNATDSVPAGVRPDVQILFNRDLETSAVMIPAIAGMILVFIGTVITSLGVVRERQTNTLEQLAVMPFRPRDVFVGKIAPYFVIAAVDLTVVLGVGVWLFSVPFRGSVSIVVLGALLFLFVTLGLGILISSVSQNQGQAVQLAIMTLLPQVLLSGMIFPVESMAAGIRWISYLLPLTYFIEVSRGVMLRAAPLSALWFPMGMLALLGVVVFGLAIIRFRRDLAPRRSKPRATARPASMEAA
ncbi:ABC transporter permease [soil metagenome]